MQTPEERGAALAADPHFSRSISNAFACATCHPARAGEGDRLLPGAPLAGVTARPSYWGGAILDLFEAVSACYRQFMRGGPPRSRQRRLRARSTPTSPSLEADAAADHGTAVPFTPVRKTAPPAAGDPARGQRDASAVPAPPATASPAAAPAGSGDSSLIPDATERAHPRAAGYTEDSLPPGLRAEDPQRRLPRLHRRHAPLLSARPSPTEDIADIVTYLGPKLE